MRCMLSGFCNVNRDRLQWTQCIGCLTTKPFQFHHQDTMLHLSYKHPKHPHSRVPYHDMFLLPHTILQLRLSYINYNYKKYIFISIMPLFLHSYNSALKAVFIMRWCGVFSIKGLGRSLCSFSHVSQVQYSFCICFTITSPFPSD